MSRIFGSRAWASAPLLGRNGLVDRTRGIPEGAPLSPALANHFLSGFDRALEDGVGGHLVRYADDICVCCRSEEDALGALWQAEVLLRRLHLELAPEKSYVSSFERGFSFLGWVFYGDHGFEESPSDAWVHPLSVASARAGARSGRVS